MCDNVRYIFCRFIFLKILFSIKYSAGDSNGLSYDKRTAKLYKITSYLISRYIHSSPKQESGC